MASPAAWMEPSLDEDKLSYEIFSILESKFLFGYEDPKLFSTPPPAAASSDACGGGSGKVRILSIDATADGLLAGASLVRLEASLRKQSSEPAARIVDFFDLVAGSGAGGVLAALLFTRGPDGRPLFSATEALHILTKNRRRLLSCQKKGLLSGILCRSGKIFRRIFGDATLRDTLKPVLIPCYDLATGAPFVFSRADAVESDSYDFLLEEVCAATCADPAAGAASVEMRSVDGLTRIRAVGGRLAMGNPTAAAITHVLNNRHEFPCAAGVEDLLVISIGGEAAIPAGKPQPPPSAVELVKIAGGAQADVVDQAVAMAFGESRATNYVRIQGYGGGVKTGTMAAEETLSERGVESVLFRGRKLSDRTNGEKLDWFAGKAIKEQERRKRTAAATVVIKPAMTPARSSASTFTTMASTVTSGSF